MKLMIFLFLLNAQIFSQTYFDVYYSNGDPMSSTPLSSISKITFSGTDVTFHLTDNSTNTKALSILSSGKFSSTDGGNPLPVELTSFNAFIDGDDVILKWTIATEIDNYGFEIERSVTQITNLCNDWKTIGFVEGYGNSNSPKSYSFVDDSELFGTIQYRLKQIDTDGLFEYSDNVTVEKRHVSSLPTEFSLSQNYPNPFNPETKITFSIPEESFVSIIIYDALGKKITTLLNEKRSAGEYEVLFDGNGLSSGIYFCRMSCGEYVSAIKMMITK